MGRSFVDTLGGGDGNWPPDGGGPREPLSGRDPIQVPDDLSELAEESARVRAELRTEAHRRRRQRWLRRLTLVPASGRSSLRLPLLLLTLTVAAGLTALFAVGAPGRRTPGDPAAGPSVAVAPVRSLPALDLLDSDGRAVSVRALLPAVILLIEGCVCDELISATAGSVPTGVGVLVVARSVPAPPTRVSSPNRVRRLADPAGELRSLLGLPAAGPAAGALVVTADAEIALAAPAVTTAAELRPALERLR